MPSKLYRFLAVLSVISFILVGAATPDRAIPWQDKVDPSVLQSAALGETEFLVYLTAQADLSAAKALPTKLEKGDYVFHALNATAQHTQEGLIAALNQLGVPYRSHWIANMLWVRGSLSTVQSIASRSDVAHVYANPQVALESTRLDNTTISRPNSIEWNLSWVHAPEVWALGYTGQGVVVGGQDTGYEWDHPAIKNQYRGWNGISAEHDYNWFDATSDHSQVPVDPHGHGTHTMGIMVGDDGQGNQIGMAPGARWIGCRNMDAHGFGTPETYSTCFEWLMAPTRLDGSDPRPDLAPDVINNSWGCTTLEGCNPETLLIPVQNLVAAGIVSAQSAGNYGNECGTIQDPPAIYAQSFTVGATDYQSDTIATFSSQGPVEVDSSYRPKPDISAPGVNVRSAYLNGEYISMNGTSMASPHVAGLVALLISAQPALRGQVEEIESTIERSALQIPWTGCTSSGVPNNRYGWGRIDALTAVQSLHHIAIDKEVSDMIVKPGGLITYTLTITHEQEISPTTNVVLSDTIPLGTSFVSATDPYTQSGNTILWDRASMDPRQVLKVDLTVRVEKTASGNIVNTDYTVRSDQVAGVNGAAVSTPIAKLYFFPMLISSP